MWYDNRQGGDEMAAGMKNLQHALADVCTDPDCEIHAPTVIEDDNERLTALAWYYAGAVAMHHTIKPYVSPDDALELLRRTIQDVGEVHTSFPPLSRM
jgi:hypothetical protein